MRIAVGAGKALMPQNFSDFLHRPAIPRQRRGRVMAHVMPSEILDMGRFQAIRPLLFVIKSLVRVSAGREQQPAANLPKALEFIHNNIRNRRMAWRTVFSVRQQRQALIEVNIAPLRIPVVSAINTFK